MRNSPALESVDNALRLLVLLRQEGRVRLSDAADDLGIARSTAHRLMSTLRARGFAVQGADKAYRPGPELYRLGESQRTDYELIETARPHMLWLNTELNETVQLMVRDGTRVRFLHSVEASHVLRVSSRAGGTLPAHLASGGKALLAECGAAEIDELYGARPPGEDPAALRAALAEVRRIGYGVNSGATERGITAVGMAVHEAGGRAVAALAVSAPSLRLPRSRFEEVAAVLRVAVRRMEGHL
ncbi:IclR family transcriptional regulator [Nocardiopsis sp. NPDC050513]|uniref:IclR family transcriptional regulator n=1 Tax=Nocardiopsis sp. NPDC050513 TaxID=3364338 RepID=UPI0037A743DE